MGTGYALLLTAAVVLVLLGVFRIARRDYLWGAVLIAIGLLVGPGGVSLFH